MAISDLGEFHLDESGLPPDAEMRVNGLFDTEDGLTAYLDDGGLLLRDGAGNPVPNPLVHIVLVDHPSGGDMYQVYIDEDS